MTAIMTEVAIENIEKHVNLIKGGRHKTIRPGNPFTFTDVHEIGEGVWQGDVGIEIVSVIPEDYIKVENPTTRDLKLAPGKEDGAKHILDSFDGVTMYRPPEWEKDFESLRGPVLVVTDDRKIEHIGAGKHGTTNLCKNTYQIRYQRTWNAVLKQIRKTRD